MATKISFQDAVKAAKLMQFMIRVDMLNKGMLPPFYTLSALAEISSMSWLTPEWSAQGGTSQDELLLFDGSKCVFKGLAKEFGDSKFVQEYLNRIERDWKAFELVRQMQQCLNEIDTSLVGYKGDYTDTKLYQVWSGFKS
jgi:hypothetical protein